jgi:exopolyphosphatase/guanosine-5'-triphosphate,3'-diphosphate pyrophosphatase
MNTIRKLAAIDIGSNAVRLLISSVIKSPNDILYKKISLVRVPLRLGEDVFSKGKLSKKSIKKLSEALKAFKLLMILHKVDAFKAVATSAMREALNSSKIIDDIFKSHDILIDIISGKDEATIIANVFLNSKLNFSNHYLYVDVGGGSTELNFIIDDKIVKSKSFKIGTVRALKNNIDKNEWISFENWIEENTIGKQNIIVIGSGGNASKILKISNKKTTEIIDYNELTGIENLIKKLNFNQRVTDLQLNPDRADVIIPAIKIYLLAMSKCKSKSFIVPRIGLADGIIRNIETIKDYGQLLNG